MTRVSGVFDNVLGPVEVAGGSNVLQGSQRAPNDPISSFNDTLQGLFNDSDERFSRWICDTESTLTLPRSLLSNEEEDTSFVKCYIV